MALVTSIAGYMHSVLTLLEHLVLYIPRWLNYIPGDIFFTDGIVREENFSVVGLDLPEYYNLHSAVKYPAYMAEDEFGNMAGREFGSLLFF